MSRRVEWLFVAMLAMMACDPWSRAAAERDAADAAARNAAAHEAEQRAKADAAFGALAPAEHLQNAKAILHSSSDDPLSSLEPRRGKLDRAERHLRAIPAGAPEARAAAELGLAIAKERATLPAER